MIQFLRNNSFSIIYIFFLGIMPLLVSSSISYWIIGHESVVRNLSFHQWILIYAIACITMAFAMTPTTFVALLSGYFLGLASAFPVAAASWLASWLGFTIAKLLDGGKFLDMISQKPKVMTILRNLRKDEFKIILLARLSPVLPFSVTNVVFSFSGTKLKNFLTAGFLGMIPRTCLAIWAGSQAEEVKKLIENPNEGNLTKFLLVSLVGISLFGITYFIRKAIK